jgi:hypothetical protein
MFDSKTSVQSTDLLLVLILVCNVFAVDTLHLSDRAIATKVRVTLD